MQSSAIKLRAKALISQSDYEKALEILMSGADLLSDESNQSMLKERCFLYIEIADLLKQKGLQIESIDFK